MSVVRWIVWIAAGVLAVLLLLFAVAAIGLSLVDTRALQNLIAEQMEETTGRELQFEGELELSLFPWLGFRLGETRLANAPGFGEQPFLVVDRTEMRVRVLPLLRRQVVLDTIVLREPALALAVDAGGRTNWDDLVEAFEAEVAEADPEPAPDHADEDDLGLPFTFRVDGVRLVGASIDWRDDTDGTAIAVRDLDLTTGAIEPGTTTPINLSVRVAPDDATELDLVARTDLTFTLEPLQVALAGLVLDIDAAGDAFPESGIQVRVEADVDVDVDGGTARIEPLALNLVDTMRGEGRMDVDFGRDVPHFEGALAFARFDARALARRLGIDLPAMAHDDALRRVAMQFDFVGTADAVAVPGILIELDDSRIEGEVNARLAGRVPHLDADFRLDAIDLDRYLPAPANGAAPPAEEEAGDLVADLPREDLQALDADARFRIGRAGFRGLDATEVDIRVILAGGVLTLDRGRANLAGGGIDVTGRLDARSENVATRLGLRLDALQAEPLIAAFLGNSPLLGRMDSTISLATAGTTAEAWLRALDGDLVASFSNGEILGLDLGHRLRGVSAGLRGEAPPPPGDERRTLFQRLSASANIENGVLRTRSLDLQSDAVRATGDGTVDLAGDNIDYTLRLQLTDGIAGVSEDLRGLAIPLRVTGSMMSPSFSIGLDDVIRARARQETDETREAARREEEAARQRLREEEEAARSEIEAERRRLRDDAEEQLRDRARDLLR